ncbi:MAG: NAD(P)/FAD-dependent oxidoreductase [Candidatus Marinimicrobia bacterium]|nr:NAD(P)/FAD-dependent oxidoreductase [Candidatus Neomarinimicrobiota bacterium]
MTLEPTHMAATTDNYQVIIVGGGPSGAAAALYARRQGLSILLLDRATFPRDKVCGDALSGKSVTVLNELGLLEGVRGLPGVAISRIIFGSPADKRLEIDLRSSDLGTIPEGFVIRREVFDQFMFEQARAAADTCLEGFTVRDLVIEDGYVRGVRGRQRGGEEQTYRGQIVMGADGTNSVVARKTGLHRHESKHQVVALRQYWRNVAGLSDQIELHYVDEVMPGYFWLFPLENGTANIGIGMLHHSIKRKKVDLKAALQGAIESGPFRERFAGAEPLEKPVGWNLPVGSKHRRMVGDGFMLLGDAAGLIDPFTGEGIGNALYAGKYAAEVAAEAVAEGNVSAASLARYDKRLWGAIGGELRLSSRLQKIGRSRFLLNAVIAGAARNRALGNLIAGMIADEVPKKALANPLFYLKILFN